MIQSLQDATTHSTEVGRHACKEGAQVVMLPCENTAVVPSAEKDTERPSDGPSIVDHILSGPAWNDDFIATVNERSKAPRRPDALTHLVDTSH